MTTVVNNPAPVTETGGSNFLIGVIILVGFIAILLYFGIPAIKQIGPIRVNIPAPQVVIPDKINVNVNQNK
jgi:hypothetical protein